MQSSAKPGEPCRVGLPLEPGQALRQHARSNAVLLDVVEASAVDLPQLAHDTGLRVLGADRRVELVVEQDEVERRADPGDAGHDVEPAHEQVSPLAHVAGVDRGTDDHVHGGNYRRSGA